MTQPVDIEALRALMERAPDLDELRNDLSMPATATLLDALPSLLTELEALRAERGRMENGLKVAEDATLSQPAADAAHPPADALREAARKAHDTLIELNPNNYTHEDVCAANDAAVEAILLLADALGERHGKTEEWWNKRRAALSEAPSAGEG